MPYVIAEQLRLRGHDVKAVTEDRDLLSKSDSFLLEFCLADGRVIVTENGPDFQTIANGLLYAGRSHAGLVYTTPNRYDRARRGTIGRLVTALDILLTDDQDPDEPGVLASLSLRA